MDLAWRPPLTPNAPAAADAAGMAPALRRRGGEGFGTAAHGARLVPVAALTAAAVGTRRRKAPAARGRAARAFSAEAWRRGFLEPEDLEQGFYFVDCELPEDLKGTYFRNGPGKFQAGEDTVVHEMDGDGLMLAMTFDPEEKKVCVRHRLVQTQGLLRDQFSKGMYTKGHHGTPSSGGGSLDPRRNAPKHAANATMVYWENKLLACGCFGKPFEIDPACLGTVLGNEDEGSWNIENSLDSETTIGSFPKVCGTEGCLTFISQSPSALDTTVRYVEYAPGAWRPRYPKPRQFSVGGYTRFSDFGITPRWLVLAKPPLKVDALGAALGKTFSEVLNFDASGSGELIFATRLRRDEQEITVPVDGLVCEEFVNAYEDGTSVILDMVAADRWDGRAGVPFPPRWEQDPGGWPRKRLVRYEVDLASKTFTKKEGFLAKNLGFSCVNPAVVGKKHRFVFGAVAHADGPDGPAQGGVAKIDMETGEVDEWLLGPSEFCGEPLFIPREGNEEDSGYLMSVIYNGEANRSECVVLDAKSPSSGPVARFALGQAMPHGQRGTWVPELTYTEEEMKRKTTLMRMFAKKSKEWNAVELGFSAMGSQLFQRQGTRMR